MKQNNYKLLILLLILLSIAGCSARKIEIINAKDYVPDRTVNVILDTDVDTDVDDAGALAVLYSYAQEGKANILATAGSCNSGYAASCLKGLNSYYGFPNITVGVAEDCPSSGRSPYQKIIAAIYGERTGNEEERRAVDVYREALAKADDNSVVIIVLGPLNNLYGLLLSEGDGYSQLSGRELVASKVKLCAVMGGCFSQEAYSAQGSHEEYNIGLDVDAAAYVAGLCPAPILWSGWEIGNDILTGNT